MAIFRYARPERHVELNRTIIEARPNGWLYAGRVDDGRWAFGFHTSSDEASKLRREPARWETIVRAAPCLTEMLGNSAFDRETAFRDARSAELFLPLGERWVACGDAAMCFDPIAGQGLFGALRSGMAAACHVRSVFKGEATQDYAAELSAAATIYRDRRRKLYAEQQRWPNASFWRYQREAP